MFVPTEIEGVFIRELRKFDDHRGWLTEIMRRDETPVPFDFQMAYISVTSPGVSRGPHEHRFQSDFFAFLGPGDFQFHIWENREDRENRYRKIVFSGGASRPIAVIIPPGVVHGYRNVGTTDAWSINLPDRLYKGRDKAGVVDEIRYEDDPENPFQF